MTDINIEDLQELIEEGNVDTFLKAGLLKEANNEDLTKLLKAALAKVDEAMLKDLLKSLAEGEEGAVERIKAAMAELQETEKGELEETEKNLSAKAKGLIKDVLKQLNSVRSEIPAFAQHIFETLAKLAGYPTSAYGYPKVYGYPKAADLGAMSDETKQLVKEQAERLLKLENLPEAGRLAAKTLAALVKEETEDEVVKDMNEEVKKEFDKIRKEREELRKAVELLEDEKKTREMQELAKEYKHVPAEDLPELLKALDSKLDSESFEKVKELLGSMESYARENDALMKEYGSSQSDSGRASDAWGRIEKEAKKKVAKDSGMTFTKAVEVVMDEHPEWYREYEEQKAGGK